MSLSGLINVSETIQKIISGSTSTFTDKDLSASTSTSVSYIILTFIIFIIILYVLLYITMFIGSYLFNNSVVKIFSSTKKITIFEFFCLYIVINMLVSCNCNCNSTNEYNTFGKSNFADIKNKNILLISFGALISLLLVAITLIMFSNKLNKALSI